MTAIALDEALQQGSYQEALTTIQRELKASPKPALAFLSFELKAFLEDFEGALADLALFDRLLPEREYLEEFRHVLINGQTWCYRQTLPDFPHCRACLGIPIPEYSIGFAEAIQHHASGNFEQALAHLQTAQAMVPKTSGELTLLGGHRLAFTHLSDSDALTGPHLVCSHRGALLDLPFAHLSELEFLPGNGFQDALWRPTRVTLRSGEQTLVRAFGYYVGTGNHSSEYVRKLQLTTFDYRKGYEVAVGQRDWTLFNDSGQMMVGLQKVRRVVFHHTEAPAC